MRRRVALVLPLCFLVLGLVWACGCGAQHPRPRIDVGELVEPVEALRPGVVVERRRGPTTQSSDADDGVVTLVRFDMSRFRLRLLAAGSADTSTWRSLPEWARDEGLVAAINAAMFEPDGRASGLMVTGGVERSPDVERFGGVLAFDPRSSSDAAFSMTGRDCDGGEVASLRARYDSVVTNLRLLGCDGEPIAWVDERRYSSAAFGLDRDGRFVLIHARTPYRMRDLSRWLADPSLGLTQVHYVEGGPKATVLVARPAGDPLLLLGRRGDDAGGGSRGARPLPNVLGLIER